MHRILDTRSIRGEIVIGFQNTVEGVPIHEEF